MLKQMRMKYHTLTIIIIITISSSRFARWWCGWLLSRSTSINSNQMPDLPACLRAWPAGSKSVEIIITEMQVQDPGWTADLFSARIYLSAAAVATALSLTTIIWRLIVPIRTTKDVESPASGQLDCAARKFPGRNDDLCCQVFPVIHPANKPSVRATHSAPLLIDF